MPSGRENQPDSHANAGDEFEALLQRAVAGDDAAVAELVESLRPYLLLIANQSLDRDLRGKLGASDLVQSALIAAYRNFGNFQGTTVEDFNRWVKHILNNNLIDARRRFKGTARRNVDDEIRLDDSHGAATDPEDSMDTPRKLFSEQEKQQLIERAMAELPENYRRVIQQRNWHGLGFREIGEQFNTGEDAARKLWSRALLRLNDLIHEKYPELDSIWFEDQS